MNTLKKRKRNLFLISTAVVLLLTSVLITSCKDNDSATSIPAQINLSTTQATAAIGDSMSVDLSFVDQSTFDKIKVVKTHSGIIDTAYHCTLNASTLSNPYTFKDEVKAGDEVGICMYSFYGYNSSGKQEDASDVLVNVQLAYGPMLRAYDWQMTSMMIAGYDLSSDFDKDDVNRFNADFSWELDWGTILSANQLETLNSYCSWKEIGSDSKIDSLFTIRYNVFAPSTPIITKYKVIKMDNKQMVLESREDWSVWGLATDEVVKRYYTAVDKSSNFTPYRGANPASYVVSDCNPGSY